MRQVFLAFAISLALAGAVSAGAMSVKDEMKTVVDPATNTIFAVGGEVDPANGPDAAKVPAARWAEALKASQTLRSAAAHLTGPQKQPGDVWAKSAADFASLAQAAEKAAAVNDGGGFSKAANDLGDTCTACHSQYKKQN